MGIWAPATREARRAAGGLRRLGTKGGGRLPRDPDPPALRERPNEHKRSHPYGLEDPVFPASTGRRNTNDNVRWHIVNTARERANELLAADDRPAISHLTPHTLRRTFASMLAELECASTSRSPTRAATPPNSSNG